MSGGLPESCPAVRVIACERHWQEGQSPEPPSECGSRPAPTASRFTAWDNKQVSTNLGSCLG
ncbi:hypothetical protein GCM10009576_067360 [Streptomyces rhizosphaericus]|uniref:Uncharacterized protein n=2 Tax=Streptomyces rhizosphaericus TaxID=114699 RepID=A0ABN1QY12_9ACTN